MSAVTRILYHFSFAQPLNSICIVRFDKRMSKRSFPHVEALIYLSRDCLPISYSFAAKVQAYDTLPPSVDEQKTVCMEGNVRFLLTPLDGIARW